MTATRVPLASVSFAAEVVHSFYAFVLKERYGHCSHRDNLKSAEAEQSIAPVDRSACTGIMERAG